MKDLRNDAATTIAKERTRPTASVARVGDEEAGQRIDNWLLKTLKGVPRSHIYRLLRSGEVRVNSGRVDATYRVTAGDRVRIPPVRVAEPAAKAPARAVEFPIVHEDDALIVVDKPAGTAVHGGSGVSFGVIESLRAARPQARFLELVHRLDRETSGLLIVAKKRAALVALQDAFRERHPEKRYVALVKGRWRRGRQEVTLGLRKYLTAEGERRVAVDRTGRESRTTFSLVRALGDYSLLSASIETGRTHQIRVQLAHLGFPIVGDDKYGDFDLNRTVARDGLRRMFLHASDLAFDHPATGAPVRLHAPLPPELERFVAHLEKRSNHAPAV
jgi:23S rRNA pseudouridine955/2504/2580 synthase